MTPGSAGRLAVVVDRDLCEGCGNCLGVAPEIFDMDEDFKAVTLTDAVGVDQQSVVRRAAVMCPTGAITSHLEPRREDQPRLTG